MYYIMQYNDKVGKWNENLSYITIVRYINTKIKNKNSNKFHSKCRNIRRLFFFFFFKKKILLKMIFSTMTYNGFTCISLIIKRTNRKTLQGGT